MRITEMKGLTILSACGLYESCNLPSRDMLGRRHAWTRNLHSLNLDTAHHPPSYNVVCSRMIELSLLEHYKTILVKPLAAFSNLTMIPELLSR